jgi:hypothetical protein
MTWQRLEAGHIDPEVTEGISAALADPLWLLARQWQVGEFRGEDAASPVLIEATVVSAPISEYWVERGGRRVTIPRSEDGWPLETLVEHEPIADGPAQIRVRLESGADLTRRLVAAAAPAAVVSDLRQAYAFTDQLDEEFDSIGHARLALLARRGLDGRAVTSALDAVGGDARQLPELAALDNTTAEALSTVISEWARREASLFRDFASEDLPAWVSQRLEYRFGVSVAVPGGTIELDAPEYPGGRLDWYHFDVRSAPEPTKEGERIPGLSEKNLASLAAPLEFAGMAASRWWEFEDHDVDFGDLAGGPDDLARSVIAAYAMVAGDDWFVVPCTLPSGTLAHVKSVRVLDDFGLRTDIHSTAARDSAAASRPWRFFELTGDPGPERKEAPLLFLPPVISTVEQSRPLESVEFRRDEMANMAWAIERRVESEASRPVDREAGTSTTLGDRHEVSGDDWQYRLSTDVPDHWVPLVPVRINGTTPQVVLRRGRIATEGEGHPAKGRILEPERPFVMREEEIPVGGIRVNRRYQAARGADGKVNVWVGRHKAPSGGPMRRTPLRFDRLTGWNPSS